MRLRRFLINDPMRTMKLAEGGTPFETDRVRLGLLDDGDPVRGRW